MAVPEPCWPIAVPEPCWPIAVPEPCWPIAVVKPALGLGPLSAAEFVPGIAGLIPERPMAGVALEAARLGLTL